MDLAELKALQAFEVSIENKVAHLQLSRPDAYNSMNSAFWRELPTIVEAIDRAAAARVVVLSSTGKHFTAGMDLEVFSNAGASDVEPARAAEAQRRRILQLQAVFNALEHVRMPVLVAVQGGCIGGGVDMICAADCRYCTEDSYFVVKETQLGITADLGTLQRLPKLIPEGLARELAYTSRKLSAAEALTAGLVNAVYKDQQAMLESVMQLAQEIARHSPLTVAGTKTMFNYARDHSMADSLDYMATWQAGMCHTAEIHEAMTAKAEGREADFQELGGEDLSL